MAITLTAGNFSSTLFGYIRSGSSSGFPAFGSVSAEPVSGLTLDILITGGGADQMVFVGNQVAVVTGLTVNGVTWPLGTGAYDSGTDTTGWAITGAGVNGFNAGGTFTVDVANTAGPDTTPPTITSTNTASVAEGIVLAKTLTANETVTWSIVGGADQAQFEISGSTLRWASNGTKDYESPADSDSNNTYVVTVRATDTATPTPNTTDQTITVTVTDVLEYNGPTYVAVTAAAANAAATSITFASSGRVAGDQLIVAVMTANQAMTAPSGFTEPAESPQSRGTAGAATGVRLSVYEKVSDGTETTVTIADSGDIQYAVGIVIRKSSGTGVSVEAGAGNNVAAATSCTFGGVTTTVDQCLVVTIVATDRDSAGPSFSGQANASLTNLTERFDAGTTTNTGGGLVVYTAEKAAAGATGNTTATQAAGAAYCWITLAYKNVSSGASAAVGRADQTDSALALARAQIRTTGRADSAVSSLALAAKIIRVVGLTTCSEVAVARGLASAPGRASEADAALALTPTQIRSVGRADEASAAIALGRIQTAPTGLASNSEAAQSLARVATAGTGRANEVGTALGLSVGGAAVPIGRADASDTALSLAPVLRRQIGAATEADVAAALAGMSSRTAGLAITGDSALAMGRAAPTGLSVESNLAIELGAGVAAAAANENESAVALGVAVGVGVATEFEDAFARSPVVPMDTPADRTATSAREDRVARSPAQPPRIANSAIEPRVASPAPQPSRRAEPAVIRSRVAS